MRDLISRDALISKLQEKIKILDDRIERRNGPNYHDESNRVDALNNRALAYEKAIEIIQDAPTVDAVPAVRCGECKCKEESGNFYYCHYVHAFVPKNFGCICGKRKDGEK